MAIGIFRKLADRARTVWNAVKDYLPLITKIAAPAISTAFPSVAPLMPIVQQGIETITGSNGDINKLAPSNPLSGLANTIATTTSPFIKFNKSI